MRQLFQIPILLLTLGAVFSACDPCANLDCAADKLYSQFKIISATTGRNLVFGPNKVYDTSQIRFFAVKKTDTTYFKFFVSLGTNSANDTALQVDFHPKTDTAYIRFSSTDVDTLTFSFSSYHTKCCGDLTDITGVVYNNAMQIMANQEVLELKKQ